MLSRFSHVRLFATLWTVACPVPLSMGILMRNQNNNKKECLRKFSKQKGNNKEKNNLEYQEERNSRVSENMGKVNRSLEFYKLCLTVDEKIITSSDLVLTMCVCMLVTHSCLTLCDSMDCSPPGYSVHGILQERVLEWVAMPFSREIFLIHGSNPGLLH